MVWRVMFVGDEHSHAAGAVWQLELAAEPPVLLVLADFRGLWLFLVALGCAGTQET